MFRVLAFLLIAATAWGQYPPPYRKLTPPAGTLDLGPVVLACENQSAPATPPTGQIMYCKSGSGWCAKDSTGTERCTGAAGGGTNVALDLGNNGVDESSAIVRIQTTGDTNSIFTEAPADELLIDVSKFWPSATNATNATTATTALDLACSIPPCVSLAEVEHVAPLLGFASCADITGTDPIFLGPGSCSDPAEARAQTRVKNTASFGQLSCQLSATTGTRTATITARRGACGGALSDSTVVCTIATSSTTCDSGANSVSISANECLSLHVTADGAFPSPAALQCSLERLT